jgi:thiol-disulfide isomerase/thioredoxin
LNPAKVLVVTVLAGTLSIGIALYGERWLAERDGAGVEWQRSSGSISTLPDMRLPDLKGREIASNAWAGKVVVLNYWATWCPPCLREMPILAQLQDGFDSARLQIVGIAIDEQSSVRRFLNENTVSYQILLGDVDAIELSQRLGNRTSGLPFTAVFDRLGKLVFSQTGEITAADVRNRVLPLLEPKRD